ncbi:MAG: glutamate-5-semialdehyde dehydrogenase, partial [Naasia sp.]
MSTSAIATSLDDKLRAARSASRVLATVSTEQKDRALRAIADGLVRSSARIIDANALDLEAARRDGVSEGLQDRLRLDETRLASLAEAVIDITALVDPVGESVRGRTLPNGLRISQVRVPFGVVGAIYEARPNVTIDIAALALKSGNAVVLRGGTAAENSNRVLVETIQEALESAGLPASSVQTIDEFGRDGAKALMRARGLVDVLIPRGSAALINTVVAESTVPVIETGAGVVHAFIDESADSALAAEIVHNAKTQRTSVCNTLETLLVHRGAADRVLAPVLDRLRASGVTLHADAAARAAYPDSVDAVEDDWSAEYYSLDLAVKIVDSLDEALEHIDAYSTHHTETIITSDYANAERFLAEVDSAVVMVNA